MCIEKYMQMYISVSPMVRFRDRAFKTLMNFLTIMINRLNASGGFLIISTKPLHNCENDSLFRLKMEKIISIFASRHSKSQKDIC